MPTINNQFSLEITPEKYLKACNREEIIETWLLIHSERFRNIIEEYENRFDNDSCEVSPQYLDGDRTVSPR